MNDSLAAVAEYVSPGHPDRLADAIAESIVDAAVTLDPDALVAVEVAVYTNKVFIDGRIACGNGGEAETIDLTALVRNVYQTAGYGGHWKPSPDALVVIEDLCRGPLVPEERQIRNVADDQNVVIGYAVNNPLTNYLPLAHYLAHWIGRGLRDWRAKEAAEIFGPDFKLLVHLRPSSLLGQGPLVEWEKLVLSIQHRNGLGYEDQHRLLWPALREILRRAEKSGLSGAATSFTQEKLVLNGAGAFELGGPEGDNGLSGKKLVVDHYGPSVSIGGGALCGKDPHKIDRCGPLRARQLAKRLVREGATEALVTLCWAPGQEAPDKIDAQVRDPIGLWHKVVQELLPPPDWFSIRCIGADLALKNVSWSRLPWEGYFTNPTQPWEAG